MPVKNGLISELEQIVREAGIMAQSARKGMVVSTKPDGSLVTTVDQEVERFLRQELPKLVPDTTIWGEEYGFAEPGPGGSWLVDPIDGTSNFVYGQPLWGVTVGLLEAGKLVAGVVAIPDMDWSFRAAFGQGAFFNGEPMVTLNSGPLQKCQLVGQADDIRDPFHFLPGKRRHFGAFVVEAMFLAKGFFRAMTSTKVKLYDAAGSLVVLRELGIEVRTLDGELFDEGKWMRDERCEPFAMVPQDSWPSR